jgi:hypothetical protein
MWFNLAASKGDENAKVSLVLIAKEMTPSQIAETQKMERECEKNNCKNCE